MHDIEQLIIWGGIDNINRITSPIGCKRQSGITTLATILPLIHSLSSSESIMKSNSICGSAVLSMELRMGHCTLFLSNSRQPSTIAFMACFLLQMWRKSLINFLALVSVSKGWIAPWRRTSVSFCLIFRYTNLIDLLSGSVYHLQQYMLPSKKRCRFINWSRDLIICQSHV